MGALRLFIIFIGGAITLFLAFTVGLAIFAAMAVIGLGLMLYFKLTGKGIINPVGEMGMEQHYNDSDPEVIEAEYEVVEEQSLTEDEKV